MFEESECQDAIALAEMAGMERVPFLNELERYHVSMLNYSSEELEREIKEAKRRAQNG